MSFQKVILLHWFTETWKHTCQHHFKDQKKNIIYGRIEKPHPFLKFVKNHHFKGSSSIHADFSTNGPLQPSHRRPIWSDSITAVMFRWWVRDRNPNVAEASLALWCGSSWCIIALSAFPLSMVVTTIGFYFCFPSSRLESLWGPYIVIYTLL